MLIEDDALLRVCFQDLKTDAEHRVPIWRCHNYGAFLNRRVELTVLLFPTWEERERGVEVRGKPTARVLASCFRLSSNDEILELTERRDNPTPASLPSFSPVGGKGAIVHRLTASNRVGGFCPKAPG